MAIRKNLVHRWGPRTRILVLFHRQAQVVQKVDYAIQSGSWVFVTEGALSRVPKARP